MPGRNVRPRSHSFWPFIGFWKKQVKVLEANPSNEHISIERRYSSTLNLQGNIQGLSNRWVFSTKNILYIPHCHTENSNLLAEHRIESFGVGHVLLSSYCTKGLLLYRTATDRRSLDWWGGGGCVFFFLLRSHDNLHIPQIIQFTISSIYRRTRQPMLSDRVLEMYNMYALDTKLHETFLLMPPPVFILCIYIYVLL